MAKILRVNMSNLKAKVEDMPQEYERLRLGGRGITSAILFHEVDPTCEPLSEENKLVFAPGTLGGTATPCSGRLSIGGKSPLTGTIKETNAGGTGAQKLARLGIMAIIVEGKPKEADALFMLQIDKNGVRLMPADDLKGLGNFAVVERARKAFGDKVSVTSIGQAGEWKLCNASVAVTDTYGRPDRHAGRGALGGVMGSKGLKAIVVDDSGTSPIKAKDEAGFLNANREMATALREAKNIEGTWLEAIAALGTPGFLMALDAMGGLPTKNYRSGSFEGAYKLSGERIAEIQAQRGGKMHGCHPGCVIQCSIIFNDAQGQYLTSGLEYGTLAMLGSNLEIDDLDAIAEMNRMCNDLGLDTFEMGGALAVCAEAGLLPWGDAQKAKELIAEVERGTPLGRILGQGMAIAAKVMGVERTFTIKGQNVIAVPNVSKVMGVTFCNSPFGPDHTYGTDIVISESMDPKGKVERTRIVQKETAVFDNCGLCWFSYYCEPSPELLRKVMEAFYATELGREEFLAMGERIIKDEVLFNRQAGFGPVHDRMPEFWRKTPFGPSKALFDVPQEEIDKTWPF